jgi:hypothetical protein
MTLEGKAIAAGAEIAFEAASGVGLGLDEGE